VNIFSLFISRDQNSNIHTITICSDLQETLHRLFLSTGSSKLYTVTQTVHCLQPSTAVLLFYITQEKLHFL